MYVINVATHGNQDPRDIKTGKAPLSNVQNVAHATGRCNEAQKR